MRGKPQTAKARTITATLPDGTKATRRTQNFYTHVVVSSHNAGDTWAAQTWHTRPDLAERRASELYKAWQGEYEFRVVAVDPEVLAEPVIGVTHFRPAYGVFIKRFEGGKWNDLVWTDERFNDGIEELKRLSLLMPAAPMALIRKHDSKIMAHAKAGGVTIIAEHEDPIPLDSAG